MAHGLETLKRINNEAAARTAAAKNSPYVPWDVFETRQSSLLDRLPLVDLNAKPKGWSKVTTFRGTVEEIKTFITSTVAVYSFTIGFVWHGPGVVGAYTPSPEVWAAGEADKR